MAVIITAVAVVTVIGIICAVMLSVASKVMAVEVDERIPLVRECLPGANCGGCGFPGCDGYAAALVQLVEIVLKKYVPALHASLGVYLPLITTNCAVLGVCIDNVDSYMGTGVFGGTYIQALSYSLGAGVGFLLAMVLFAGVRGRIEDNDAPPSFKGMPITLVSAAILSVAFFGFTGVVDNLFG